ncbi:alpha/beta hydrolase family protein [Pseudoalteromonas denitrificans]|uniref:Predicted alpha/beta hydrolase n=1 Tax=Pseudoalteromonas denitrificans DSM 6059 TaxID=1123010 RepID=A0A1I1KS93_9GAMM|nr:alpha/beta fold hydrolase [Pseudoalteromonas denitrificans]SFC61568.1 Predicted alpha/beta hydrolase [Pseudoalteromonas denitrificans DSM 6059]
MTIQIKITCSDGRKISAMQYQATHTKVKEKGLILLNSALGIKQSFYQEFAQFLANQGYIVITWDPRGIGLSKENPVKNDTAKLRDWGQIDLNAVLNYLINNNITKWQDITLLGHSAGGHLIGLCPSINKIKNIILVSSGTCSWRLFSIKQWPRVLFAWLLLVPIAIKVFGYMPGKLGIGHDLPKGVIMDWRNWSLKRDYLFSDLSLKETFYQQYQGNIQAFGFSDDFGFSPKKTIFDLMAHFPNAQKKIKIFNPKELNKHKIGHFGFFKPSNQDLWQKLIIDKY